MTADDVRDALETFAERFDFGEYESKAYLAILEHGELTASEIADRADVPQPRVYDTVRDLSERGLVEIQETRPMRVLAVDPEEAFDGIQTSLSSLVDELDELYTASSRGTEAASLVKSRPTILRYVEDVIESAEYELVVSLTPELLERFASLLREKREAGVAVELLVSPTVDAPDPESFDYDAIATTARGRRGITTPVLAVADGYYSVYTTRDALHSGEDRYGVVFNRSELGFLVSGFFNTVLWTTAESISEDGDRGDFPRRYATIRRCVSELRDAEGTLYAAIEGRDVVTGERRSVEGEVAAAEVSEDRQTATLQLDTDEGIVEVGGQAAAIEDVEAHEIRVGRGGPPEL